MVARRFACLYFCKSMMDRWKLKTEMGSLSPGDCQPDERLLLMRRIAAQALRHDEVLRRIEG